MNRDTNNLWDKLQLPRGRKEWIAFSIFAAFFIGGTILYIIIHG